MPEYEVYRDMDELVTHYSKRHYTCDKGNIDCYNLVFEDTAQLSHHYLVVHKEKREVRVEFGFSDEEDNNNDDEEEKKKENTVLTKENYKDLFPSLA